MAIGPAMTRNLPYDVVRDFLPVVHMVTFPQVLVVSPALPVDPASWWLTQGQSGRLNYSSGVGATNHLAMEMLRAATGLNATHVPIAAGWSVQAILSNDVQMCIEGT